MNEASKERLYPIGTDEVYFGTGVDSGGHQRLVGLLCPNLVMFCFDQVGNLVRTEKRSVSFFRDAVPPFDIYDERLAPLLEEWKEEIGFRPTAIRVKKFWSAEYGVGIEDYPSHFDENLMDPNTDEDEKTDIKESMKLWDEAGQFVLQWGNDYWLDDTGSVVSS